MKHDTFQHIACYVLTEKGLALAKKLKNTWKKHSDASGAPVPQLHIYFSEKIDTGAHEADLLPFKSIVSTLTQTFCQYDGHIFICAAGIAGRAIAPHLDHKKGDPAVVVCDEKGHFAISLLSGHFGGGNALASHIAKQLKGQAVITTASDVHNTLAVDMLAKKQGFTILDWEKIKLCNGALLHDEKIQLYDPIKLMDSSTKQHFIPVDIEKNPMLPRLNTTQVSMGIHWRKLPEHKNFLRLTLPVLHLGIGCKQGTSKEAILDAIDQCLEASNLEKKALACLASVDIKADEQGLRDAAHELGLPLHFYPAETLAEAPCLTPSGMAAQLFGLESISVSEGAALTSAFAHNGIDDSPEENINAENAALIVPKMKFDGKITIAIAVPEQFIPE